MITTKIEPTKALSPTKAKMQMRKRIIKISLSCWGTMWAPGIEYALWEIMTSKSKADFFILGFGHVFAEEIIELVDCMQRSRCWCTETAFVAVSEWQLTYSRARATQWANIPTGSVATSACTC